VLDRYPPGKDRNALLTWREEIKSHRPGLLASRADAMNP